MKKRVKKIITQALHWVAKKGWGGKTTKKVITFSRAEVWPYFKQTQLTSTATHISIQDKTTHKH